MEWFGRFWSCPSLMVNVIDMNENNENMLNENKADKNVSL